MSLKRKTSPSSQSSSSFQEKKGRHTEDKDWATFFSKLIPDHGAVVLDYALDTAEELECIFPDAKSRKTHQKAL